MTSTPTSPTATPTGTWTVIFVSGSIGSLLKLVALINVLKVTFVAPVKLTPVRTIMSPTYPASGVADVILGTQLEVQELDPLLMVTLDERVTPVTKLETVGWVDLVNSRTLTVAVSDKTVR